MAFSSSSPSFPFLQPNRLSSNTFRPLTFKPSPSSSHPTIQLDTPKSRHPKSPSPTPKKKQKPKPSFYAQVREKWSVRIELQRKKFPWEEEEEEEGEGKEEEEVVCEENGETPLLEKSVSFSVGNNLSSPPWLRRSKFEETHFDSNDGEEPSEVWSEKGVVEIDGNIDKQRIHGSIYEAKSEMEEGVSDNDEFEDKEEERIESESLLGLAEEEEETDFSDEGIVGLLESSRKGSAIPLPWERSDSEAKLRRNKAEVAEKTIPEAELRRLRNISLRMMERIKVRAGGITQPLVDRIHEKWKVEEVVKLKFEGAPGFNMKRTHDTLESRTGGLVIWRSGSSVVLYRGMAYTLPCVQQYAKLSQAKDSTTDDVKNVGMHNVTATQPTADTRAFKSHKDSSEETMKMTDLDNLLDELGPRFIDWSGPEPVPVDADLLPSVVPGYTPPVRLLPYKVRPNLGNKRMTTYRRLARLSPPHFALGRNRELQGLAMAMVKLWKRNTIAKIAIKRGVLNTRNERMAEELKKLTRGDASLKKQGIYCLLPGE